MMQPLSYAQVKTVLHSAVQSPQSYRSLDTFCKTGAGQYAAHDRFIGVPVPVIRNLAFMFKDLPLQEIRLLLNAQVNEERQLALFILIRRYQKGTAQDKETIYQYYLQNLKHVNNWNLVDSSAHLIVGAHTMQQQHGNIDILFSLARSTVMWERRIAMVATWWYIRKGSADDLRIPLAVAEVLLQDTHDLIRKAVGWMLREVGKREQARLIAFLDCHAHHMPRTTLRYAVEKLLPEQKQHYLFGFTCFPKEKAYT